jgi:hypothetical protein
VTPDGTRRAAGTLRGVWPTALARGERLVVALRAEIVRGNLDAAGEVWIVDTRTGLIVRTLPVVSPDADDA